MSTDNAAEILAALSNRLDPVFAQMEWAEDEIEQAQRRHPARACELFHSFALLGVQEAMSTRMGVEAVYRAHARELLERVASGADTRPGTAVEVVVGLLGASVLAPLTHEAYALVSRMWVVAGLPEAQMHAVASAHYEALMPTGVDAAESAARKATRVAGRTLGRIECNGWHHGEQVACIFTRTAEAAA